METIVRLDLEGMSQSGIAVQTGVNRTSVQRVLARTKATRRIIHDLAGELSRALDVYRNIQRTAWEAIRRLDEQGRNPATLLAEIRLAQSRIDALMALEPTTRDDPRMEAARFRSVVTELILSEAPELAPKLAAQLNRLAEDQPDEDGDAELAWIEPEE
jgi:hypothetical protein